MLRWKLMTAVAVLVLAAASTPAHAALINYFLDQGFEFRTDVGGIDGQVAFFEATPGPVGSLGGRGPYTQDGVTFTSDLRGANGVKTILTPAQAGVSLNYPILSVSGSTTDNNGLVITFPQPIDGFALGFASYRTTSIVTPGGGGGGVSAFLNLQTYNENGVVDTANDFLFAGGLVGERIFASTVPLTAISLSISDLRLTADLAYIDFSFAGPVSSVPEPASLALLGLGLVGASLARRKRF